MPNSLIACLLHSRTAAQNSYPAIVLHNYDVNAARDLDLKLLVVSGAAGKRRATLISIIAQS